MYDCHFPAVDALRWERGVDMTIDTITTTHFVMHESYDRFY